MAQEQQQQPNPPGQIQVQVACGRCGNWNTVQTTYYGNSTTTQPTDMIRTCAWCGAWYVSGYHVGA